MSTLTQPLTRERLGQGLGYDEYKAGMTGDRATFDANERAVELSQEDLAALREGPPLSVLVITEDWCGDAVAALPVLGRVASEIGRLDLRIIRRDSEPDLSERYKNGPYLSIPVFVFLAEDLTEIARWIERPASVTERRRRERAEIYASDPRFGSPDAPADQLPEEARTELQARLRRSREEMRPFVRQEVLRELREILTAAR